jgi:hypothetical protein
MVRAAAIAPQPIGGFRCCLPSAMDDPSSAATGTVMRQGTFERYAKEAGFDAVSVLQIEHDFLRFYRLDR